MASIVERIRAFLHPEHPALRLAREKRRAERELQAQGMSRSQARRAVAQRIAEESFK